MIRRYLSRGEWEKKLRSLGAEPLDGLTPLNTAEWWKIKGRPPFTVPVEDDGTCEFWALQKLVEGQGGPSPFKRKPDS